jgi:hypothetical protein
MRLLGLVSAITLCTPVSLGQGKIRFDKLEHLEGYDEGYFSQWRSLYPIEEFEEFQGRTFTRSELKAIQERWKDALHRVQLEIEELQSDPEKMFDFRLLKELSRHKYFKLIAYETIREGPFVFLVQSPAKPEPGYARNKAAEYTSLFEPIRAAFEERYVIPFELERRGPERFVVAVLATTGDFQNYARTIGASWHYRDHVFQDPALGASIIHESPISPRDRADELGSARHAFIHALQAAYLENAVNLSSWVFESMAGHMGGLGRMEWDRERIEKGEIRTLLSDGATEKLRRTHLLELAELLRISHPKTLATYFAKSADFNLTNADHASAWWSFYRQAGLLHRFLFEEREGRYAPRYETFLSGAFEGRARLEDFVKAMEGIDLVEIDRDFRNWLVEEYREAWPEEKLSSKALDDEPAGVALNGPGADATRGAVVLNLAEIPVDGHLGSALHHLRAGRTSEARLRLELAEQKAFAAHQKERIRRANDRIDAWERARREYFLRLVQKGGSFYHPIDGKNRKVAVREVGQEEIVVEASRNTELRIRLDDLEPLDLIRRMKGNLPAEMQWVRAYVLLLHGDARWRALARGGGAAEQALIADAGSMEEVLFTGHVADLLVSFAELPAPRTPNEGEGRLEAIGRLLQEHGARPMIQANETTLISIARRQAQELFELRDPWTLLGCRVQSVGDERVRLVWDFESEDELRDFQSVAYLDQERKRFGGKKEGPGFQVRSGELVGEGEDCLLLPVELAAPLEVHYTLTFGSNSVPAADDDQLGVAICDDRKGHYAWLLGFFFFELFLPEDHRTAYHSGSYYGGVAYDMRLVHDGKTISSFWEETAIGTLEADRREGSMFLWVHTETPLRIGRLEVEGKLAADPFRGFRAYWVEEQLEKNVRRN